MGSELLHLLSFSTGTIRAKTSSIDPLPGNTPQYFLLFVVVQERFGLPIVDVQPFADYILPVVASLRDFNPAGGIGGGWEGSPGTDPVVL